MRSRALTAVLIIGVLATPACKKKPLLEQIDTTVPPSTAPSRLPAESTGSPTPQSLRSGPPSKTCVDGWREPARGTALRTVPLDLLRNTQQFTEAFQVVDLRYFTGPDDANIAPESKQTSKPVERWYGKVVYTKDPTFRIRFLAVRRIIGSGVVAVARYDSTGFRSPDWWGFEGEGGPTTFNDIPGKWYGSRFDYVKANELPPEVAGCLAP